MAEDERRRLDAAIKSDDSLVPTYLISPLSRHLVRWAAGRGVRPNTVTLASMGLGVLAAGAYAAGSRPGLVAGSALLQAAFVTDCVDGQLARYTGTSSPLGAWLDGICDRAKEYAAYAGLALGSARGFDDDVWPLAAAALSLQTARHLVDYSYPAVAPRDRGADSTPARRGVGYWARRTVVLPIGERFLLLSVTAAAGSPRTVFRVLLAWGAVGAAYGVAGKALRSVPA